MSPSRGAEAIRPLTSPSSHDVKLDETEIKANERSSSALSSAKRNLRYLYDPESAKAIGARPGAFRTRALLRSLRYIGIFIFWRIVRYAKYALVGSVMAAIGASAIGSGAAFVLAPPTILSSIGVGIIWAMGKWGFNRLRVGEKIEQGAAVEIEQSRAGVRQEGQWRDVQGPNTVPW